MTGTTMMAGQAFSTMTSLRKRRGAIGSIFKALKTLCAQNRDLYGPQITEYWDVAKALCTEVMGGRFKHAAEKARAEKGQLMRVALIDELNAQRSRFTFNDPFWNLVATDNMKINRESFDNTPTIGCSGLIEYQGKAVMLVRNDDLRRTQNYRWFDTDGKEIRVHPEME